MYTFNIPVAKHYIDNTDIDGVTKALASPMLSQGPICKKLETKVAKFIKVKYACAVSSGTAGLHLALLSLGIGKGDEVITTPFTFIATSNTILYVGAKPVFVDIDERTFNLDPTKIENAISEKTKAILVVHVFGHSVDMDPILKIAKKHKLYVIEDACESFGSMYKKRMTGGIGDIGVFSFYPNKQITTGEGGMIVTNSQKIYRLCDRLRTQGAKKVNGLTLYHQSLGYNYRMTEMSASLGITQLRKFSWMTEKKAEICKWYEKYLKNVTYIEIPEPQSYCNQTRFTFIVRVKKGKRQLLKNGLEKKGIESRYFFLPIYSQPFMKKDFGSFRDSCPTCERLSKETLALPLYIGLKESDIKRICAEIKNIL